MIRAVVGLAPSQGARGIQARQGGPREARAGSEHVQGSLQGANCPRPSTSSGLSRSTLPSMVSFCRPPPAARSWLMNREVPKFGIRTDQNWGPRIPRWFLGP